MPKEAFFTFILFDIDIDIKLWYWANSFNNYQHTLDVKTALGREPVGVCDARSLRRQTYRRRQNVTAWPTYVHTYMFYLSNPEQTYNKHIEDQ